MNEKQKNTEGKGRGSCGMNVIVGSWEQGREDCDMDIWGELETPPKVGYPKVDYCTMPLSILSMIPTSDVLLPCGNSMGLATRDALYTIKCSHLGWDIKWDKIMLRTSMIMTICMNWLLLTQRGRCIKNALSLAKRWPYAENLLKGCPFVRGFRCSGRK